MHRKFVSWLSKFKPGVTFRYKHSSSQFWLHITSKPYTIGNDWVVECGERGMFGIMYSTGQPQKFILEEDIIFKDDNA